MKQPLSLVPKRRASTVSSSLLSLAPRSSSSSSSLTAVGWRWWWLLLVVLPSLNRTELLLVSAQGGYVQEEPTNPPTTQFQGAESGYIVPIAEGNGPNVNQDRIVDDAYCYLALKRHDTDNNGRLDKAEFQDFAQDFGSATECLDEWNEIPIEVTVVFNQLACDCIQRGGASDCCTGSNSSIPISGVDKTQPIITEEQDFLQKVCLRTDQAIVTYCKPPPIPIIPPLPPAILILGPAVPPPPPAQQNLAFLALLLLLLLLCPWRRRCIFCAGAKPDDESSEEEESEPEESDDESEDAGGARRVVTEEGGDAPDVEPGGVGEPEEEEGAAAEPDNDAMALRAVGEEEDGEYGGASYGRTIEMPEYDEEGDVRPAEYEQYDKPQEPPLPMALKPIPGKSTEDEDEPYDLEHYVPDAGLIEYQREGEWRYDADGGWVPDERAGKDPSEWPHGTYDPEQQAASIPADNRRLRHLDAYGGGEVFDQLANEPTESNSDQPGDDMFDWVIRSTLNTLDERNEDLVGSVHSSSEEEQV